MGHGEKRVKICLVCSSGGHFLQLYSLKEFWEHYDRLWVTLPGPDTEFFLSRERKYFAHRPTARNLINAIRNILFAIRVLRRERPDIIVSTGAGVAVPFIFVGRLFGTRTIYIESISRVNSLSLSGRLVYHVVNYFFVQWPELNEKYGKTLFKGSVL